jgi:regulator of replication initiation timing
MNYFYNVLDPLNEEFPQLKQQLTDLKEEIKKTVVISTDLDTELETLKNNALQLDSLKNNQGGGGVDYSTQIEALQLPL